MCTCKRVHACHDVTGETESESQAHSHAHTQVTASQFTSLVTGQGHADTAHSAHHKQAKDTSGTRHSTIQTRPWCARKDLRAIGTRFQRWGGGVGGGSVGRGQGRREAWPLCYLPSRLMRASAVQLQPPCVDRAIAIKSPLLGKSLRSRIEPRPGGQRRCGKRRTSLAWILLPYSVERSVRRCGCSFSSSRCARVA